MVNKYYYLQEEHKDKHHSARGRLNCTSRHAGGLDNYPVATHCSACSPVMEGEHLTSVVAGVVCCGQQWSLHHDSLVSSVNYVIHTSADVNALITMSWISVYHQILIEFHKPILKDEKNRV